jgi:hypothetical protein
MTISIGSDYLIFDGSESFTFQQGQGSPVTVNNCLREKLNLQDLTFLAGAFGQGTQALAVRMWNPELPSNVTPKQGDHLTDSNSVLYVIQNVEYHTLTGAHRCLATKGY